MALRPIVVLTISGSLLLALLSGISRAQSADSADQSTSWAPAAISHAQRMKIFPDVRRSTQTVPRVIPKLKSYSDPTGRISTFQSARETVTADNPFFQNLGTNDRTCFTCHQPETGWTISAASAQARFARSEGTDPLFRLFDGATCPSDDVSTQSARSTAYKLLTGKGLVRIGLAIPANSEFEVSAVSDPYGCSTNPVTGLTSPTSGILSMYRRPLPATNLGFDTAIMWDGREPSLAHQALDATLTHAQANGPGLTAEQQAEIVNFETGLFTAQSFDNQARSLRARSTRLTLTDPVAGTSPLDCRQTSVPQTGGPQSLYRLFPDFFAGINDPFGLDPCPTPFTEDVFDIYSSWARLSGNGQVSAFRRSVARGEALFDSKPISITGVSGLNDALGKPTISGVCGTCHDTPNVGNHSVATPLNIGIADAAPAGGLDASELPVFTLKCTSPASPLFGQSFNVTDPGRALITGKCADIGKFKGPILRGLAARAPYFHNGSAATLSDVVEFYDQRFGIGFSDQEKRDLAAFLATL